MAGRTVTLDGPAEHVLLIESRDIHEFAALEGDDFYTKIAGWGPDLQQYDGDTYQAYLEKFPQIADIPDIGFMEEGTFSIEKATSVKPDVVFMALWMYQSMDDAKDAVAKFEQAGIPVIITDYGWDPIGNPPRSIVIMGKAIGKEERAQEIADYYNEQVHEVYDRLQNITNSGVPKPTVYLECGFRGPAQYGNTYLNHSWNLVIQAAGGKDITADIVHLNSTFTKFTGPLSVEYVLKSDPDIIIISGSYWVSNPGAMRLGYKTTTDQAQNLLNGFIQRPGWTSLSAVENGRIYGIFHGFSFRIYDFASLQAFAKWFYPDEFKDVNPEQNLKDFMNQYEPVGYSGTWMVGINK
jgi:iron complex transport system substrate-binding protein